jgi:hypothetical protein
VNGRAAAGATLVALAVAAIVVLAVTNLFQAPQKPAAGPTPAPAPAPTSTVDPHLAPSVPAHGAYFGAWVAPSVFSQQARVGAVDALQQQIGRRLDIVHIYLKADAAFPTTSDLAFVRQGSMLLVSWALNDTRAIISGADDSLIRQRAQEIKAVGKPIFLEWRWEMDRPNLRSQVVSGADYIAAWKHIRAIFTQQKVDNVAWVWCPTARGFASGDADAFYPGNDEVDWVCTDAYPGPGPLRSFADVVGPFLAWASHHAKPVMIGEYGVPLSYSPPQRASWLRGAAQTVQADQQVKALVYFDANPAGDGLAQDTALESPTAVDAFRGIADDRYFNTRALPVTQPRGS